MMSMPTVELAEGVQYRASGHIVFFFASYSSSADCAGLNWHDHLLRYNGGPKIEPKHHVA